MTDHQRNIRDYILILGSVVVLILTCIFVTIPWLAFCIGLLCGMTFTNRIIAIWDRRTYSNRHR